MRRKADINKKRIGSSNRTFFEFELKSASSNSYNSYGNNITPRTKKLIACDLSISGAVLALCCYGRGMKGLACESTSRNLMLSKERVGELLAASTGIELPDGYSDAIKEAGTSYDPGLNDMFGLLCSKYYSSENSPNHIIRMQFTIAPFADDDSERADLARMLWTLASLTTNATIMSGMWDELPDVRPFDNEAPRQLAEGLEEIGAKSMIDAYMDGMPFVDLVM